MNYHWQRFWYKDEDSPITINGFLYVHEYTKGVFTLDSVSDISCLVLRGEPGMGKSREIEKKFKTKTEDENNKKIYFNLSSYGDENRLIKDIFYSDKMKQWKESDSILYFFLDSLDEALININTLALLLADEIEKLPKERLFLRIACRTAEWSNLSDLENKLKNVWKEDKCQILQISPLQQKDVEIAAQSENLSAENFLAEVFNKNVSALASKPVTLQFLLNLFRKNGSFPSTQTELYEKGCLTLCEEKNERRKASKRIGKLTPEQRFVISARIASLMIFGNKSSIWISGITGEEENSDILIGELSGYCEKRKDNSKFQITEEDIKEVTFETGLFTGNGNNRLKFSHQTFAEFLAAWYLEYRELSDELIIKIIGENYLYPQLYETSAWIASRRKTIFQHLMKIEPLVLLRSDVLSAEEYLRAELTKRLLELFEKEDAKDDITRGYYQKLKHSNLAEQLHPFITDKSKGWLVKRVAIDIAEACEVQELQKDLLELVLDETELHPTRVNAAYAVKRIADNETKSKLKPLIHGGYANDENLELKGVAISALWREQLTTEELFEIFVEPPHNFLGSNKSFFYQLSKELQVEDLPIVLNWLQRKIIETGYLSFDMQRFADEVMTFAWQNLNNKETFEAYIKTILPFLKIHREGLINSNDKYNFDKQTLERRRKVLIQLLPHLNEQKDWFYLNSSPLLKFRFEDVDWLMEEWNQSSDNLIKDRIMSILKDFVGSTQHYFSDGANPDFLEKICREMDSNQEFKDEIYVLFEAIELNSEIAIKSKARYEEILSWHKVEKDEEELLTPTPKERVLDRVEKFEGGDTDWFWRLNLEMTLKPNAKFYGDELESDLTKLSGWQEADEETRIRIFEAAKKYILDGESQSEKWIWDNTIYRPAFASYRALKLISKFDADFIINLDKSVWGKWASSIYFYPMSDGVISEEATFHRQIIALTYKNAPERILEFLAMEIKKQNKKEENPHISFGKLELCWDKKLKKVLKDSLVGYTLSDSLISQILAQLFELNDEDAEKLACDLIKYPIPKNERNQQLMIIGIKLLIQYGKMSCWEKIWKVFSKSPDFGKKIVESGVFRFGRYGVGSLPEQQTADLFIWLSKHYPHNEDPDFSGEFMAHFVGPREETGSWRNSLLEHLKNKGSPESVSAIERIKEELPHLDWLKFTLLDAQENMRLNSWQPLSSGELLKIFSLNKEKSEGEELKSVASLESIERKIDMLSSKIDGNQEQMMEQFANLAVAKIQSEISKLTTEEREQFEEVKKEKWETKLKFVIPLIPKIPYLGEFFPSASMEVTKNIESEEYIDFVQ